MTLAGFEPVTFVSQAEHTNHYATAPLDQETCPLRLSVPFAVGARVLTWKFLEPNTWFCTDTFECFSSTQKDQKFIMHTFSSAILASFNIRSGYLPNIVAVNSAKFITIYREFGRRDLARSSRVGGVRGCFKLYLLAVTRHKKFVFTFQTWQIVIVWNGQVFLWDLMSKINILRSWDQKYVYTNTR